MSRHMDVSIGSSEYNVLEYGAVGDGETDDTTAIQATLDLLADGDGGTVVFPGGRDFLIYSLFVHDHTELRIEGTLLVSNDRSKWDNHSAAINCDGSSIAITGGGLVDGQGEVWWAHRDDFRPKMVAMKGDHGLIHNVSFVNPPNHCLELYVDWLEISHAIVKAPPSTGAVNISHNTDAVDVHGEYMYIHDVIFDTGDDDVAVHSNHTFVERSYFGSGHGASIGSLCNAYITNITFRDIHFNGTTAGAKIKTHPGCSGRVWNVLYENLTMLDVHAPIVIDMNYEAGNTNETTTMRIENVTFSKITSRNATTYAQLHCQQSSPCEQLEFVDLDFDGDAWICDAVAVDSFRVHNVLPAGLSECLSNSTT